MNRDSEKQAQKFKEKAKKKTFAFDLRVHEQVWTGSTSLQKFLLLDWTKSPWQIWWLCTNLPIGPNLVVQNWPPSIVTPLWQWRRQLHTARLE